MDCFNCKINFDENEHMPRLLIQCGHSICHQCTNSLFQGSKLICPECQTYNYAMSTSSFPKNLAILNIQSQKTIHKSNEQIEPKPSINNNELCLKHMKPIEAYCETDKMTLCITCILEDGHRNHDISNIMQAAAKEKQIIQRAFEVCKLNEQDLKSEIAQWQMNCKTLSLNAENSQEQITIIFDEMKQQLIERENQLKTNLYEQFKKDEQTIFNYDKQMKSQLNLIYNYYQDFQQYEKKSDIYILNNSQNIKHGILQSTTQLKKLDVKLTYPDIDKENEINQIFFKKQANHSKNLSLTTTTKILKENINQPVIKKKEINSVTSYSQSRNYVKKNESVTHKRSQSKNWKKNEVEKVTKDLPITQKLQAVQKHTVITSPNAVPINNYLLKGLDETHNQSNYDEKINKDIYQDINYPQQDSNALSFSTIISQSNKLVDQDASINQDFDKFLKKYQSPTPQDIQYIFIFGGFIDMSDRYTIECLDLQKNIWNEVCLLPYNRVKFGLVQIENGNLLLIGGKQDGERVSLFVEFDINSNQFKQWNLQLSNQKSGFGCICHQQEIYIIGGNDGHNVLDVFESYNYKTNQIKKLPRMQNNRDELSVTLAADGCIYAIGGFGGPNNQCLKSVERFDISQNKWLTVASLNVPRRAMGVVSTKIGIYVMGGFDGNSYLNTVEKYCYISNRWEFVANMNFSRCTLACSVVGDQIYAIGGFDNGPLNSVEKYSISNDRWEMSSQMLNSRFMHVAIGI